MKTTKSENFSDYVQNCYLANTQMTYENAKSYRLSDIKEFIREKKLLRREFYDKLKFSKFKKGELINMIMENENKNIKPKETNSDVKHSKTIGKKQQTKNVSKKDISENKKNIILNNNMEILKKHLGNDIQPTHYKDYYKLTNEEKSKGDRLVYCYNKKYNIVWIKTQNWVNGKKPNGKPIIEKNTRTAPLNTSKVLRKKLKNDMLVKIVDGKTHWFSNMSYDKCISILNERNMYMYEIIEGDRKFRPYFDIDGKSKKTLPIFLEEIKKILPKAKFSISGSEEMLNKSMKYSYHITINNYYFSSMIRTNGIKDYLDDLVEKHNLEKGDFDSSIYQNHRAFKLINQSKHSKDLRVQKIIKDDNPYNHIVTYAKDVELCADDCFESYKKFDNNTINGILTNLDRKTYKKNKNKKMIVNLDAEQKITKIKREQPYININKMKPRDLLNCICPSNIKYDVSIKIALWCLHEGLRFQDFYGWGASYWGVNEEWRSKWLNTWNTLSKYEINNIRRDYIQIILEQQYGKLVDKHREKFFDDFYTLEKCKYERYVINKENPNQYIDLDYFNKRLEKFLLFAVGMGAGKTYTTAQFLKENRDKRFLWITNRISLKDDVKGLLSSMGIDCEDYKTHNGKMKDSEGNKIGRSLGEYLAKPSNLICEIESIYKYEGVKYDYVIMDEIESLFNSFLTKTTHGDKKKGIDNYKYNWMNFCDVIKGAEKVFMMDAFMSKRTTDFIKDIGYNDKDIFFIQREDDNPQKRKIRYYLDIKRKGGMGFYKWYDDLIKDINAGKNVYVFYPHKGKGGNILHMGIDDLAKRIMEKCNLEREDIAVHFSGSEDNQYLSDVRKFWNKKRVILTNTTISVGVSFDIKDYIDDIYMCYDVFVNPRDLIQSSNRIRHPKNKVIKYVSMLSLGYILNDFIPCEQDAIEKPNELYNDDDFRYKNILKNIWNNYLILEYDTKDDGTLFRFFEMAGLKTEGVRYGNSDYRSDWEEFNKIMEKKDNTIFNYDNIETINDTKAQEIRELMNYNKASMIQQQQLRRYYNDKTFDDKTDEKIKKSFWLRPHLLRGFLDMRDKNILINYCFNINQKLWDNVRRRNYAMSDDDNIVKFNKIPLTNEDKEFITSKLHLDITHTDTVIKRNILTYYFGKGIVQSGKEANQYLKNHGEPMFKSWFPKLLEYFVKNSKKNIYNIHCLDSFNKRHIRKVRKMQHQEHMKNMMFIDSDDELD
jgi:hypothetical protein